MTNYSHTRICTFEQCRYRYDLKYNKNIKVYRKTIEAFMGSMVHETLEKLYIDLGYMKILSLEDVLSIYNDKWKDNCTDDIIIAKKEYTAENYRMMGEECIRRYYERFAPFDQVTILGLETDDHMDLGNGNSYSIRIDKFACIGNDYYVCDYKTESRMKTLDDAEKDRQLSMYAKWVKDTYPDAEHVFVLWHMLRFDKDVVAERTVEQMDEVFDRTNQAIRIIEACSEWTPNPSALCDYCEYRDQCPEYTHLIGIKAMTPGGSSGDEGVTLVDELTHLQERIDENKQEGSRLERQEDELKGRILAFATGNGLTCVYGTDHKASIRDSKKIHYTDKDRLKAVLKEKGLYDGLSGITYASLNSKVKKGDIDPEVIALAEIENGVSVSLSKIGNANNRSS